MQTVDFRAGQNYGERQVMFLRVTRIFPSCPRACRCLSISLEEHRAIFLRSSVYVLGETLLNASRTLVEGIAPNTSSFAVKRSSCVCRTSCADVPHNDLQASELNARMYTLSAIVW